jgi:hypothetical protein
VVCSSRPLSVRPVAMPASQAAERARARPQGPAPAGSPARRPRRRQVEAAQTQVLRQAVEVVAHGAGLLPRQGRA